MEENPRLKRYEPKINIKTIGIVELANSLRANQKMTLLDSEGALGNV